MRKIILLIGLPGVGKTTFIKNLLNKYDFNVTSPDNIRREFGFTYQYDNDTKNIFKSNYNIPEFNDFVFDIAKKKAEWYLENKYHLPLVIDATNINHSFRQLWIELAHKYNAELYGIYLDEDINEIKKRNEIRQYNWEFAVPNFVIDKYKNKLNITENFPIYNVNELNDILLDNLFSTHIVKDKFIAIGDIHGDYDSFVKLLNKVGINIENNIINIPEDLSLIILGDFIDRGDKSLELIQLFMKTQKHNNNLIVLMGNHEYKIFRILNGEKVLVRESQIKTLSQLSNLNSGYLKQIKKWLHKLPYVVRNKDYIFTHAAVLHDNFKQYTLHECIGFRNDVIMNDKFYNGTKKIVHGHVYTTEIAPNVINIDKDEYNTNTIKAFYENKIYEEKASSYVYKISDDYKDYITYKTKYAPKSLVSIKEDARYAIIKYTAKVHANPELFDKYTKNARGLVYDKWSGKFIVKSFKKFYNDTEDIDNLLIRLKNNISFKIYEKYNGFLFNVTHLSNCKLFYSCNGSFGDTAPFVVLGKDIITSNNYDFSNLEKNVTYMFEAIHPDDKHHVDYNNEKMLILLAKRKNDRIITSDIKLDATKIGCPYVTEVSKKEFLRILKSDFKLYKTSPLNLEGYVLYFEDGYMAKVKLLSYLIKKFGDKIDADKIINIRKNYIKFISKYQ